MPTHHAQPFISPESPSYESASREFRHPASHPDADLIAALSVLCEVEHNAAEAYRAAIVRVKSLSLAADMQHQVQAHQDHRITLEREVTALGGSPPANEECRELLVFGALAIEDLPIHISDEAILQVLDDTRGEIAEMYAKVLARPGLTAAQRRLLSKLAH
jgi:hypothetical protein